MSERGLYKQFSFSFAVVLKKGKVIMFRVWGKLMKKNRLVKDTVVEIEDYSISRTQKVYQALDIMCYEFDLAKPIWLELNKKDFIQNARTRFTQDCFIEEINFDYLDFQVIEEDY